MIDDFNREGLAIEVDHSLPSQRVTRVLDQVADNGPEFVAQAMADWAEGNEVELIPIQPGKPTQNAYIERYNRTFRQEVLNVYAFSDLDEVRDVSTRWLYDYNHERPHLSLDRQPPVACRRRHEAEAKERARVAEPSGRSAPSGLSNPDQPRP